MAATLVSSVDRDKRSDGSSSGGLAIAVFLQSGTKVLIAGPAVNLVFCDQHLKQNSQHLTGVLHLSRAVFIGTYFPTKWWEVPGIDGEIVSPQ